jgi:lysophospholipase L1-like esterase
MKKFHRTGSLWTATVWLALAGAAAAQAGVAGTLPLVPVDLKFDFGTGPVRAGFVRVAANAVYSDEAGYGFGPAPAASSGGTGSNERRVPFSVKVPEGNYTVTVRLGDPAAASTTTIEAESGRLMLERVEVPAGKMVERSFTTNVRTPQLAKLPLNAVGREEVSLDPFDAGNKLDWDHKLTVELVGDHAAVESMEIVAAPETPTVFLAGDSTVTDRDGGGDVSWGQLLPVFLKPGVAVANHAQSGETLKSFANALRLDKILSQMKKGDYLFLQFAHNDSKVAWPQTYVEPETTYKAYLKVYIAEARLRGATPVLVTAMDRGDRTTGAPTHGHGGYPEAMREVAREEHVPLIDLYKMSIAFYEAAGADAPKILADGTHSTAYGGYEFAKCIVRGIKENKLPLADYLVSGFNGFDPAHPDSAAALNLGPLFSAGAPRGPRPAAGTPGPGPL